MTSTPIKFIRLGAALAALATLVLAVVMLSAFPLSADLPEGFQTPIIAFEFAQQEADLAYMAGNSQQAVANRQMMEAGMAWDMFFPIAYGALIGFMLLEFAFRGHTIAWSGVAVAVLIYPFDIYENITLLAIIQALAADLSSHDLLLNLEMATWLKWGAIAFTCAILSICLYADSQRRFAIVAGLTALSITLCGLSGAKPILAEIMSAMSAIFFLSFSIKAIIAAWALRPPN